VSSLIRGGRLGRPERSIVEFSSSLESDRRIAFATILVNEAHVVALSKSGTISRESAKKLFTALRRLEHNLPLRKGVEDVHVLIEEEVTKRVGGQVGGELHTGKSRNDQVATAIRMVLRQELLDLAGLVLKLEPVFLRLARKHRKSLFVGYTHLQPAQPITFGHYLLAVGDSLLRDEERIMEAFSRVNLSPMGGGALAGSSFKLDRNIVARLLGFQGLVENSLDAVGGRDFILETLGVCSVLAADISRLCQDLIFYSSADVGLVELPDEFASTSSIMPQKKNPDVLEVVRARSAQIPGDFASAITTLHALPTGYNLDFQELTPLLWHSLDNLSASLSVLTRLVGKLRLAGRTPGTQVELSTATEVANVLVRVGRMPFREAHRRVGKAVRLAIDRGGSLRELKKEDWDQLLGTEANPRLLAAIESATDLSLHVLTYRTRGSPNPDETDRQIAVRERRVRTLENRRIAFEQRINGSLGKLRGIVGRT
jgi:argininosuccinate lyase